MKIAMWSGPRNLSTALMYSFANRADTCAIDEPFYAAYLAETGLKHPLREEVLSAQSCDPKDVIASLSAPHQGEHQYQKHMTQHMLPAFSRDWVADVCNVFLIRHPAPVLASWQVKHDQLELADIGFVQQMELFEQVRSIGQKPIVIDSADIRDQPEQSLRALCTQIGMAWDDAMLFWPAGPKPYDGIWAKHWYDAVHRSTGFASGQHELPVLSDALQALNEKALPLYHELAAHKLSI